MANTQKVNRHPSLGIIMLLAIAATTGLAMLAAERSASIQQLKEQAAMEQAAASGDTVSTGEALIGGEPFTLTDQHGNIVRESDFRGKYMLVYFGFTNCPDICPTDMANTTQALNTLPKELVDKIAPIFITIDPRRDTVERIKSFAENFHPSLVALTGPKEEIARAQQSYRVYAAQVEEQGNTEGYRMDHSAITYLMGPDGKYIAHFPHGTEPAEMTEKLNTVMH